MRGTPRSATPALRLAVATVAFTGAAARAQDHDAQVWTVANVNAELGGRVGAALELQARRTDEVSRVGQILIRPSLSYELPRGWSVALGYAYVRTRFAGTVPSDEHRSWEQVSFPLAGKDGDWLHVTGRTRLEQRFREEDGGTGWRFRQQLRVELMARPGSPVSAIVWSEGFFGLNRTRWGQRLGVDQVRTFVGAGLALAGNVSLEPGYLNQTVFQPGRDRVNHVFAMTVSYGG